MAPKDNIELVRYITEKGLNEGDVSFVDEVFAPDYQVHTRGLDLPRGPEAFRAAVGFWRRSFPDFHTTIESMIGEGDLVASRFSTTGTHTGPLVTRPRPGAASTSAASTCTASSTAGSWSRGSATTCRAS